MDAKLKGVEQILSFAKLPLSCDFEAINTEIDNLDDTQWCMHVNQACYNGAWDVLPLYAQTAHLQSHPILQCFSIEHTNVAFSPLPIMERLPVLAQFLAQFVCPLKSVRLMRLHPQSEILPHNDHQVALEYGEARIHVPITGIDEVDFVINGSTVPMMRGEVWYMNADLEHYVSNRGAEPRINLVIDCKVEDWLKKIIKSSEQKF
ncbi:aspartyl/asparaginyl beta-hydroxylase domain-containing protein [Pseudoalteromonas luteoviolacea]|uniref:aspartyl/asparaginyl beta-hydroxylase domain-containing protein n=1 Tax=Pseudoalteromonas luteoviolacea TaxID=43657 RepID=UPI001B37A873|nr:aspartyl/asparaginyl beta-hydroxylase domain-containing protein [Pseudoalteromonas luteoviolacea]MBQ4811371.1 aspartyl/asparaginyl beta-hydroxylase domain-containing protein [Pseudoalteromonas luteoviolacea]